MKKIFTVILLLFPVYLIAGTYDDMAGELMKKIPAREKTKTIAVMPFSSDKNLRSEAQIATEEMTRALINAGAAVSERSQIDKMLKEQELQQAGILTNEDAGEIGQGLGAKYVVLGTVTRIDKFGEEGNIGIKINVKLVASASYKVLAAATGDVAAGDASSAYRRKAPRKAVEYPQFLEVYAGPTFFEYKGEYEEVFGDNDLTIEDEITAGISAGARLVRQNDGFYTSGWEFLYSSREFENNDILEKFDSYQVSWIPTIRLPLWVYFPSLPDYTSLSLGYAVGIGLNSVKYIDEDKNESSRGIGFCTSAILGLRIGLTDSISLIADVRYTPHFLNVYGRSQDINGESVTVNEDMTGTAVYFGISLAP